jgi:MATE family multidrug resistance protein
MAIVPAVGLAEAMQIVVARRVGEERERAIGPTFLRAFGLVLLASVALAMALRFGSGPVGERLISPPAVAEAVEDFFRYGSLGVVPFALNLALGSLWVGLGRARVLVWATAVLVAVNLALSAALIFGMAGLPALGIEGAGIGFLGAEAAALALLGVQTVRRLGLSGLGTRGRGSDRRAPGSPRARHDGEATVGAIFRLGAPIGLQALVEALRWVAFFLIVEHLGERALAESSLVFACFTLLLIPSQAFAETAYTMVSGTLGRRGSAPLGPLLRSIARAAFLVTLPLLAVALAFPEAVLAVFTGSSETIAGAAPSLRVLAVGMLVVVPAELWLAAVFGTGDSEAGFVIEVLTSGVLVAGGALAVLVVGAGVPAVWGLLPLASALGLAASVTWLRSGRWRRVDV